MLTGCAGLGAACPQPLCLGARGLSVFATVVCMDLRHTGVQRAATMLVAGALGLGLTIGLAGCDGSGGIVTQTPTPTPADSPSGGASATSSPIDSPSATASPGVTAAPLSDEALLEILPDGAEHSDLQGALATAAYFSELLGMVFETSDTTVWTALSTDSCDYCSGQVKAIEEFYASGANAEGGRAHQIANETRGTIGEDGLAYVKVVVELDDLFATASDGTRTNVEPASRLQLDYQLRRVGSLWLVNGVQTKELE